MSKLPSPRNIRRNWKVRPIDLSEAAGHVAARFPTPERYGEAVEARAWEIARGNRRGMLKRIDVAYEGEEAFASIRFGNDRLVRTTMGARAAV